MSVFLSPVGGAGAQFFDNNGDPLTGGKLFTYLAGTTTPRTTYTSSLGNVPHPNPIILDAAGRVPGSGEIWLSSGVAYKFIMKDATDVSIASWDNLSGNANAALFVGVRDYGAALDGVTNDATALFNANAAAVAAGLPLLIDGTMFVGTLTTITAPILDTLSQMFTTNSQVIIDNTQPVRPEWFGNAAGNIRLAAESLPATGGSVQLSFDTYPPSYTINTQPGSRTQDGYLSKLGVSFIGDTLPDIATNGNSMLSGTIIQGPFYVGSSCSGLYWSNIGVDSGVDVCNALYGGAVKDAFSIFQINTTTPVYATNIVIDSIRGLCNRNNPFGTVAIGLEATDGAFVGFADAQYAGTCISIKSVRLRVDNLIARFAGITNVLIGSEIPSTSNNITISKIVSEGTNLVTVNGVLFESGTAVCGNIVVSSMTLFNATNLLRFNAPTILVGSINISQVFGIAGTTGVSYSGSVSDTTITLCNLGILTNVVSVASSVVSKNNSISMLKASNATNGVNNSGFIRIGNIETNAVTGFAIVNATAGARTLLTGSHIPLSGTVTWNMTPALVNSWVNFGPGSSSYRMEPRNGRVYLEGLIKSGVNATVISAIPVNIAPTENQRYAVIGNSGAFNLEEVAVNNAGTVVISNLAGASTYLTLDGINWPMPY